MKVQGCCRLFGLLVLLLSWVASPVFGGSFQPALGPDVLSTYGKNVQAWVDGRTGRGEAVPEELLWCLEGLTNQLPAEKLDKILKLTENRIDALPENLSFFTYSMAQVVYYNQKGNLADALGWASSSNTMVSSAALGLVSKMPPNAKIREMLLKKFAGNISGPSSEAAGPFYGLVCSCICGALPVYANDGIVSDLKEMTRDRRLSTEMNVELFRAFAPLAEDSAGTSEIGLWLKELFLAETNPFYLTEMALQMSAKPVLQADLIQAKTAMLNALLQAVSEKALREREAAHLKMRTPPPTEKPTPKVVEGKKADTSSAK